jgi:predicted AAA+ superfamily ATPase
MSRIDPNGLLLRARGMAAFQGVLDSEAGRNFIALLGLLGAQRPDPVSVADVCARLWVELAVSSEPLLLEDAWRSHLVERILESAHPFALAAERGDTSPALMEQACRELRTLKAFFELDTETLLHVVEEAVPETSGLWTSLAYPVHDSVASSRQDLAEKLAKTDNWGNLAETIAEHYALHGAGVFGRYRAFRWENGGLRSVPRPDPIRLRGLIGYEKEREPMLRNTERLLAGLPSHHTLLYGLPGTGKSSTVKAILNEYADRGLRLVELAKEDLRELPRLLETLRGRGPRFILFIDDLSFEEHEVEYKSLKALLEGSVEEPPENVRLYATSNRRNLIREHFSDREEGGTNDDVHARDTMQEKLSLAARFGLRITFPSPDQKRYLEIVSGLVRDRGIEIPDEELEGRALLWDRWHAGRSGRTARQFVDELEAELAAAGKRGSQ